MENNENLLGRKNWRSFPFYRKKRGVVLLFKKVFRGVFQDEIEGFDPKRISQEYQGLLENTKEAYQKELGKLNYDKGLYAEFKVYDIFLYQVNKKERLYRSIITNLPRDFRFCSYSRVWSYTATADQSNSLQIDLLARADGENYTVIGEIKNRTGKKFSLNEATEFYKKFKTVMKGEGINKALALVLSRNGFNKNTEDYLQEKKIAYSSDKRWFE